MKVLFIANNIPLPKQNKNRIILTIAEKLSQFCDISFVFPAPFVFPPLSFIKKYKAFANLKPWKDGIFTINPVKYLRLPGKKLSFLLMDTIVPERFVNKNSLPDLCHAHFIMPDGYFAFKIKQKYNVPYIVSVRKSDMMNLKAIGNKGRVYEKFIQVLKNANKIIVHNRPQQELMAQLGFDSALIPHGIDSNLLSIHAKKPDNLITISVAAELIHLKNINWVVQAVKDYSGKQNIQLKIAGDGICRNELQRLADQSSNIHFFGKMRHEDVINLLEKSHIFAMPSSPETFGLAFLEAAAKCNAVIGHRGEGVDGLFEDCKEMMFCNDYEEFNTILCNLIENPDKIRYLASNGYQKVKNYTWEQVLSKYMEIYHQLVM